MNIEPLTLADALTLVAVLVAGYAALSVAVWMLGRLAVWSVRRYHPRGRG